MSRNLVFHYARPDAQYDGWDLVAEDDATVGDRQEGPFGVMWPVELDDAATTFTYRLQRYASAGDRQQTDPKGNRPQQVQLAPEVVEVVYPSGFAKGQRAFTLSITSPDHEHQAIQAKLDQVLGDLGTATTTIGGQLDTIDTKTDDLGAITTAISNQLNAIDTKTDDLGTATTTIVGQLDRIETRTDAVVDVVAEIREDVGKLLVRGGVIVVDPQRQPPDDVEQLLQAALPLVDSLITSLDAARTTFASALSVPPAPMTPPLPSPGDARGQAVQAIIERLFFAQLATEAEHDRLQDLAGDAAAMGAQNLQALRGELTATVHQVSTELGQVEALAQPDPADLELLEALRDEVQPKLIELRVLAAGVSP